MKPGLVYSGWQIQKERLRGRKTSLPVIDQLNGKLAPRKLQSGQLCNRLCTGRHCTYTAENLYLCHVGDSLNKLA